MQDVLGQAKFLIQGQHLLTHRRRIREEQANRHACHGRLPDARLVQIRHLLGRNPEGHFLFGAGFEPFSIWPNMA